MPHAARLPARGHLKSTIDSSHRLPHIQARVIETPIRILDLVQLVNPMHSIRVEHAVEVSASDGADQALDKSGAKRTPLLQ